MPRFQLRIGAVEAIQFFESSISEVNYFFSKVNDGKKLQHIEGHGDYQVMTKSGAQPVRDGCYILRKLDGDYHVYSAETFEGLYEEMRD